MLRKPALFILLFVLISSNLSGQQKDESGIYLICEKMPEVVGGLAAIGKKLEYPKIAKMMKVQGVVYVGFIVTKEGTVKEPKILKPLEESCNKEALRVVGKLKFIPGYHQGVAVPVRFVLPIRFVLSR